MRFNTISDIRAELARKWENDEFVTDKTGVRCVEIDNCSFVVDDDHIFRKPNLEYIERELQWYESQSLNVNDIPKPVPEIWKKVATPNGLINSNYGWAIWSAENGHQYMSCLNQLLADKESRRATMLYTRPSMQTDYNKDGMSDFMCTYSVQYMIRRGAINAYVYMRSNDAVFGFNNDVAWQEHVLSELFQDLLPTYPDLQIGDIFWNAASFHVYERHFKFIEEFLDAEA